MIAKKNIFSDEPEIEYEEITNLEYRKINGQFFTPYIIAVYMVDRLFEKNNINKKLILDPSSGLGIFQRIVEQKKIKNIIIESFEIDKKLIEYQKKYIDKDIAFLKNEDYLSSIWHENKYDYIISNPPYLKHINIKNKKYINNIFNQNCSFEFSITTNYYCYFIIKALYELKSGGRAVFIVPSEFLNSNYGEKVKEYLINEGSIEEVLTFENSEKIFRDAISIPSIIIFTKIKHTHIHFYNFEISVNNKLIVKNKNTYNIRELKPKKKWKILYQLESKTKRNLNYEKLSKFEQYGWMKRGIATGANEFFLLTDEQRKKIGIDEKYLKLCITSANQIPKDKLIIEQNDINELIKNNKKIWLLYLNSYRTGDNEKIDEYINYGISKGYNTKYLPKNRSKWFCMENGVISDILLGTFSRDKFRFIKNNSKAFNLTCFHSISIFPLYHKYIHFFLAYLNSSIGQEILNINSREHGNGMKKLEPNDVKDSFLPNINFFIKDDIDSISNYFIESNYDKINNFFEQHLIKH